MHWNSLDDSGIVHKDIYRTHFLLDLSNHCVYLLLICHVANISVSLDSDLFVRSNSLIYKFLLDVIEDNLCTSLCKTGSNSETDTIRCTCYKCNLTFK